MESSKASLKPSLSAAEIPQFVDKLQEKYVCPVCNSVLRNAMQLQCGHKICEICIDPLFGENTKASCPVKTDEECEDSFSKNEVKATCSLSYGYIYVIWDVITFLSTRGILRKYASDTCLATVYFHSPVIIFFNFLYRTAIKSRFNPLYFRQLKHHCIDQKD